MHPVNSTLECTAESWNKFFGRIWKKCSSVCVRSATLSYCDVCLLFYYYYHYSSRYSLRIFVVVVAVAAVACNDATADKLKRFLLLLHSFPLVWSSCVIAFRPAAFLVSSPNVSCSVVFLAAVVVVVVVICS